jgi:2-oxoglutarate ferredoxin oxidoreductase subunit beta
VLKDAAAHKGSTYVEIFQNCPVFNDGAYAFITDKAVKADTQLRMEHGKPLLFGKDNKKGIRLNTQMQLEVVTVGEGGVTEKDVLVHDAHRDDPTLAFMLANLGERPGFPTPIGVFRDVARPTVEELTWKMLDDAKARKGGADLHDLLAGGDTWKID